MRAMSLAADDSEGEQNELRTLHGQLNSTNELVQLLSQQLFELKEQVNEFLLNFRSTPIFHSLQMSRMARKPVFGVSGLVLVTN